jgi:hypothetical protein
MTLPQLDRFLQDCIVINEATDEGLTTDEMYGLYVSWCSLSGLPPAGDRDFRRALATNGIHPHRQGHHVVYPGMSMTGPAASDYIITSVPNDLDAEATGT